MQDEAVLDFQSRVIKSIVHVNFLLVKDFLV